MELKVTVICDVYLFNEGVIILDGIESHQLGTNMMNPLGLDNP